MSNFIIQYMICVNMTDEFEKTYFYGGFVFTTQHRNNKRML